jgi:hypothetical protein
MNYLIVVYAPSLENALEQISQNDEISYYFDCYLDAHRYEVFDSPCSFGASWE